MERPMLEDIPFRLMLVALWAVTWGGIGVYDAMVRLTEAPRGVTQFLLAVDAGVIGATLFVIAFLLLASAPFIRKLAVGTFVILAVAQALRADPSEVVAIAPVALHLIAALTLVLTRQYFRTERAEVADGGASRFGV